MFKIRMGSLSKSNRTHWKTVCIGLVMARLGCDNSELSNPCTVIYILSTGWALNMLVPMLQNFLVVRTRKKNMFYFLPPPPPPPEASWISHSSFCSFPSKFQHFSHQIVKFSWKELPIFHIFFPLCLLSRVEAHVAQR